jgi:DNA-binding MarR family transcriptional regulator
MAWSWPVSRHARTLEDHGLIERRQVGKDRRAHQLLVTPAGAAALQEITDAINARLGDVLDQWSPNDVRTLQLLLERLHASLTPCR